MLCCVKSSSPSKDSEKKSSNGPNLLANNTAAKEQEANQKPSTNQNKESDNSQSKKSSSPDRSKLPPAARVQQSNNDKSRSKSPASKASPQKYSSSSDKKASNQKPKEQKSPDKSRVKSPPSSAGDSRQKSPPPESAQRSKSPAKKDAETHSKNKKSAPATPAAVAVSVDSVQLQEKRPGRAERADDIPKAMADQLSQLVARLEAVTTRLEQQASSGGGSGPAAGATPGELMELARALAAQVRAPGKSTQALLGRMDVVAKRLQAISSSSSSSAAGAANGYANAAFDSGETAPFVAEFDDLLNGSFKDWFQASNKIGGDVQKMAGLVKGAWDAERAFLAKAAKSKAPAQNDLPKLLQPVSTKLSAVQDFKEQNRRSEYFNHLSAVAESIAALGWISVSPTPGPFVKEMADAGQFYSNRVLKDWKEKDKTHVEWVRSWNQCWQQLQAYIKKNHTTGVTWNPKGVDALSLVGPAETPAPPAAGGPPPPPMGGGPPPPPPGGPPAAEQGDEQGTKRSALMAEINQGANVVRGLKKVTDDQKTHKNPGLRLQGPAPYKAPASNAAGGFKPFKPAAEPAKPSRTELDGKKWMVEKKTSAKAPRIELVGKSHLVEFHDGNKGIVISDTNIKQTVYVWKCTNSTIQVKGKVNSITLDGCKKTAVVFDDVIASIDFINCQSVQAQIMGKCPNICIDKTDGCQVYLSKDSVNAEVVTAKSSEMNVYIPDGKGDFNEFAIPEQFKTIYNGKDITTTKTDIN